MKFESQLWINQIAKMKLLYTQIPRLLINPLLINKSRDTGKQQ
jgi:hypothetical protein